MKNTSQSLAILVLRSLLAGMLLVLCVIAFSSAHANASENTNNVYLSWGIPELRTDGSPIVSLDGYRLYHRHNNNPETLTEIEPAQTTHSIYGLPFGAHVFEISAVENGLEGARSTLVIDIDEPAPEQAGAVVEFRATLQVCRMGECQEVEVK